MADVAVMVLIIVTVPPPNKVPVKVTEPEEWDVSVVPTQASKAFSLKALLAVVREKVP